MSLVGSLGDGAADNNHLLGVSRDCRSEGCVGGDGGSCATSATSGTSILASITGRRLFFKNR
jgi:hypothetical protein